MFDLNLASCRNHLNSNPSVSFLMHNIKLFISFTSVYLYFTVNDGLHEASFIGHLICCNNKIQNYRKQLRSSLDTLLGKKKIFPGNVHYVLVSMTQFFYRGLQSGKVYLTTFARCCFFKCLVEEGNGPFFFNS